MNTKEKKSVGIITERIVRVHVLYVRVLEMSIHIYILSASAGGSIYSEGKYSSAMMC